MKNNVKNYLSLSALVAASALMVSCDDDTILNSATGTEIGDGIFNASKPVAPIPLAIFPLTSLKLSFNEAGGECLESAFQAGDEVELDFDSTTAVSATSISGDAVLDLGSDTTIVFGVNTNQGFAEGITSDPSASSWTINRLFIGSADNTGKILLSNLTLTPLASDQRSVTGSFTATAPVSVAFNQDTRNVVVTENITTMLGGFNVTSITVYEDVPGVDVEIQSLDGTQVFETEIGDTNYGISAVINSGECVVNLVIKKADLEAAVPRADLEDGIAAYEADYIIALFVLDQTVDVSPAGNQIPVNSDPLVLSAGNTAGGVSGSYRHDFDSSTGTIESLINSAGFGGGRL